MVIDIKEINPPQALARRTSSIHCSHNPTPAMEALYNALRSLAKPTDMSWAAWTVEYKAWAWLVYMAGSNAFLFIYMNHAAQRRTDLPAADANPTSMQAYVAKVLAGHTEKDAEVTVEKWQFGTVSHLTSFSEADLQALFGEKSGEIVHRRVQADLAHQSAIAATTSRDTNSKKIVHNLPVACTELMKIVYITLMGLAVASIAASWALDFFDRDRQPSQVDIFLFTFPLGIVVLQFAVLLNSVYAAPLK